MTTIKNINFKFKKEKPADKYHFTLIYAGNGKFALESFDVASSEFTAK